MYNPESKDHLSNNAYKREEVLRKYYDGTHVKTFFGRKIESDDHHALNYIIQSTTSDLFLRQAIKVWEILKDRKSEIAFCIHDSLIIDYSFEENDILKDLVSVFSKTNLGSYKTNVSVGCNFGEMRKIR
jgi:DNA polymerase I-like protein with 3'-5' exonuclease and polymerase domains